MNTPRTLTLLVLAANPRNTPRARLDQEVRDIEEGLKLSPSRDKFLIAQKHAVRLNDIRRALLESNPQVVHFCGHGNQSGILIEDDGGNAFMVEPEALADLFRLFEDQVQCVLLNACFSLAQAKAIAKHIKYVIGMREEIGDRAAIEFAVGFYDALGAGRPVDKAYEFGRNAIALHRLPGHLIPVLLTRSSASPQQLLEYIRQKQNRYVRESYGEMAHECFTDDDLEAFNRRGLLDEILQDVGNDTVFDDIVIAIRNMAPSDQSALLRSAACTHKPTWAELGRIDREGQTEAGQAVEKMIAEGICGLVRARIR